MICLGLSGLVSCSDDKDEPAVNESERYLSAQEFEQQVRGTYWVSEGSTVYDADGNECTKEGVMGAHALTAFQLTDDVMREWWLELTPRV